MTTTTITKTPPGRTVDRDRNVERALEQLFDEPEPEHENDPDEERFGPEDRRIVTRPTSNGHVHHQPDPDAAPDDPQPVCTRAGHDVEWQERPYRAVPPRLTACRMCDGERKTGEYGPGPHAIFAELTPEDLGLGPWPPDETNQLEPIGADEGL